MKKSIWIVLFLTLTRSAICQQLNTHSYRDTTIPYIELNTSAYDFSYPIIADILDSVDFTPPADGSYLAASYGHRYLSGLTNKTDNHGGFDYWPNHVSNGVTYNTSNLIAITCMCDGYISQVIDGPDSLMELTALGRSVRVTCDSSFQSFGNKIKINYRHLSEVGSLANIADTAPFGTVNINKGDTIGIIGASGTTSNVHLHMSTLTLHPDFGNAYVHTSRLFDPNKSPGILKTLDRAKINLLHNWSDSALFRVIWPYNQTINQFEFINESDTVIFNKEDAYETGSAIRDNHDCLPNVDAYAYQFNGYLTAKYRYLNEMNNMPAQYPASPNRDTNLTIYGYSHVPINHDSVAYVYDFMVKNLSPNHQVGKFKVKVSDVWGYVIEGDFNSTGVDQITVCDSLTWIDGITYSANNNTAVHTLVNALGADSIVSLNLTINSADASVVQNGPLLTATNAGVSYQWLNCSNGYSLISGETNQSFLPAVNGIYAVQVTSNGCVDTSSCFTVDFSGLKDIDPNQIFVSPNPSTGLFYIDLGGVTQDVSYIIYDMTGKELTKDSYFKTDSFTVSINGKDGTYFMILSKSGREFKVLKLSKKK